MKRFRKTITVTTWESVNNAVGPFINAGWCEASLCDARPWVGKREKLMIYGRRWSNEWAGWVKYHATTLYR